MTVTHLVTQLAEGVYEDGVKLAKIEIKDDGLGENSITLLSPHSLFEYRDLGNNQGELWLKAGTELDFEAVQQLATLIDVTGTGTGPDIAKTGFVLTVTNVDEPAELTSANPISIYENPAYRQIVTQLTATDPDAGDGPVRFYLDNGGDGALFRIHPSTGQLTVRDPAAFDYETSRSFEIDVYLRSSAGGNDAHREKVTLKVLLKNVVEAGESQLIQKQMRSTGSCLAK